MSDNLDSIKVIAQFSGQSGCRVELIKKNGQLRVRKTATDANNRTRLKVQHQKMKVFRELHCVSAPELFEVREEKNLFFFDMSYCELSRPFSDAAEEMSLYEVRDFVDFLVALLSELETIPALEKPKKFKDTNVEKLRALLEDPKMHSHKEVVSCLETILAGNEKYFGPILNMESRFCHGDLTMDNILSDLKGNKWLIDPIDCFFEHPWSDIAKLYQDIEGEWFQIRNRVHQRRASSNLWRIGAVLKEWIREKHPQYLNYHYYFLGLNFARILPYASDARLSEVVKSKTKLFLEKFMNGEKL